MSKLRNIAVKPDRYPSLTTVYDVLLKTGSFDNAIREFSLA